MTDHAGNLTAWTLDENGNATAWTIHDEEGASDVEHEHEATYDDLNRRSTHAELERTSSGTLATTYGYDSQDNFVHRVNPRGGPTTWVCDGLSRMATQSTACRLEESHQALSRIS